MSSSVFSFTKPTGNETPDEVRVLLAEALGVEMDPNAAKSDVQNAAVLRVQ